MSGARRPGLRRRLSLALVGVALVSIALLAGVNYFFARLLINDSVEEQLMSVRDVSVQAIDRGIARLEADVSVLAADPSVVDALVELSGEYDMLDQDITPEQIAELTALYESEVLPPFVEAGVDIAPGDLVPASPAGRYLQQQYIADNPAGFDERDGLDDADDGTGYSAAHAVHHPQLRALMENARMSDLILVDADSLEVVYSTEKRIDLGTNVVDGPYADLGLGNVLDDLASVAVGETVLSDSWFYVPTRGAPVFFLASAVRSGTDVVGAVVTEVPVEALTAAITAGQNWELLGLGDTGENYVVGIDRTLRSETRTWLEDPDDYLRRYADRNGQDAADVIETVGSPVLIQTVDNDAVSAGLVGDEFIGTVTNYLGTETLAASAPAGVGNVDWVVVVEQATSESNAALDSLLRRILIVVAILLPIMAVLGVLIARTLTKPIDSLVQAADRVAAGDLDVDLDYLGTNELGDLGRQLEGVAGQLESRQAAILDEERHINDVLSAILPARLFDRVRQGEQAIEDIFDTATIVSVTVDAIPEATGVQQDVVLEVTERLSEESDALMARHGAETVRRSSGNKIFVTGLGQPDACVADAVRLAVEAVQLTSAVGADFGLELTARAGVSAGDVATGVVGGDQLSFGVWGDPPNTAATLDALAQPGQILVDGNVAEQLGPDWDVGPGVDLPGLADDVEAHVVRGRSTAST